MLGGAARSDVSIRVKKGHFGIITNNQRKIQAFITVAILIFGILLWGVYGAVVGVRNYKSFIFQKNFLLNEGWTFTDSNGSQSEIDLPCRMFFSKNETVSIERKLSDYSVSKTLVFETNQQIVKVYLDGVEIYSENASNGSRLTTNAYSGWNYIVLSESTAGAQLKISFTSLYHIGSRRLPDIYFGNSADALGNTVTTTAANIVVNLFMMLLGCGGIIAYLLFDKKTTSVDFHSGLLNIGIFVIIYAFCAIFCDFTTTQVYFGRAAATMLYLFGIIMLTFAFIALMRMRDKKNHLLLDVLFLISLLNFIVVMFLQLTGILDLFGSIISTYILIMITAGIVIVQNIRLIWINNGGNRQEKAKIVGDVALSAGILIDIIRSFVNGVFKIGIMSELGVMIFSATIIMSIVYTVRDNRRKREELSEMLNKSRYQSAIGQLQPHFTNNALGAIRNMVKKNPDLAYDALCDFSKYLRDNISYISDSEPIPFHRELEHIKTYTGLEKLRFEDNLQLEYDIQYENFYVLPLSVQPFVENAVHSVCEKGGGKVTLTTALLNGSAVVEIKDDGMGFDVDEEINNPKPTSVGIKNTIYRLNYFMSVKVAVNSVVGKGTRVTITFPLRKERLMDKPGEMTLI